MGIRNSPQVFSSFEPVLFPVFLSCGSRVSNRETGQEKQLDFSCDVVVGSAEEGKDASSEPCPRTAAGSVRPCWPGLCVHISSVVTAFSVGLGIPMRVKGRP